MYDEDDLLPLSALQHLVFCERRAALIHLEGAWDENVATIEGKNLHDRSHDAGTEVRGDVRITRGLPLRSLRLGLSGKTDVVEFHLLTADEPEVSGVALPGISGRWRPCPVEYKRGRLRNEPSFEIQLCGQALCLEEMLNVPVPKGALFYGKSLRRKEVIFTDNLRYDTEIVTKRLHILFNRKDTPKADYVKNKCKQCSLFELCLPQQICLSRSVQPYLTRAVEEST